MSQLEKLIAFLDREDVSEVVIVSGRPVAVRQGSEYRPVTRADVSRAQLAHLVAGTPIAALVDGGGGTVPALDIGAHRVAVDVQALGAEIMVRFMPAPTPAKRTRPPSTHSRPRVKRPTRAGAVTPRGAEPPAPPAEPAGPPPPRSRSARSIAPPVTGFAGLVREARQRGATDLHVGAEREPQARVLGTLSALGQPMAAAAVEALLAPLLDGAQRACLDERGYVDCALDVDGGRLRANLSRDRLGWKGSFRLIAAAPPTLEQLGLPKELARITSYHQGLVVIAGPSGHGKTTTLAALVDLINQTKAHHILTIEDPVEIVFPRRRAVVTQREVGTHTRSFATALKASLRQDPDVIVIGELRDRETVEIALTAAETGHLVMATMSTPSAAKTLDRLIDMFPPGDQQQVRVSLAAALRFVLAQRLLPSADGKGVVAAVELLTGVLPLAALIRDNKLFQVGNLQQRGRAFGMIRLDDSLAELVKAGRVTDEVALRHAESKKELSARLGGGGR